MRNKINLGLTEKPQNEKFIQKGNVVVTFKVHDQNMHMYLKI